MDQYVLAKEKLPQLIKELTSSYTVFAPVELDGMTNFIPVKNASEINLDFTNSKYPPKYFVFQQTETMFKFTPGPKGSITPVSLDTGKTAIFAIRPCDARSFSILDHVFSKDFKDPYYFSKRDAMVLIGLSCTNPCLNCFCTSFNDSPASAKHVDLLLTDIGKNYYVEVTGEKGKQLAKKLKAVLKPATDKDKKMKRDVEQQAIKTITRQQKTAGITEKLDKIFDHPYWKKVADRCIGCGTCTYLCPTCHCFDIQDESTLSSGARIRVWDTCMNPEYTLHASGYNPRPARANRVRNRVYHKYDYYPKNFDVIACVGCGRCIDLCPVNIDIIDVVTQAGEVKA